MSEGGGQGDETPTTPSNTNDTLESKLSTYKQKLKILKVAYKEEQAEKEAFKKQILSLCNSNEKLQKDLNDMEQKYLSSYRENQKLYDSLIENRSSTTNGGSFLSSMAPTNGEGSDSNLTSYVPKDSDNEVLQLKIKKLEARCADLVKENEKIEQEKYNIEAEAMEMETEIKKREKEIKEEKQEVKYQLEDLENRLKLKEQEREEREEKLRKELEEKHKEELDTWQSKLEEAEKKFETEKDSLKDKIKELEAQYNEKADEILQQGVEVDKIKEDFTIEKEKTVKLENEKECLKEMVDAMKGILEKHEHENRLMAEKLVAFKQQLIDTGNYENEQPPDSDEEGEGEMKKGEKSKWKLWQSLT